MELMNGVITPIVSAFHYDESQSINFEETKKLIDYLIERGVSGIFALGTNGEFQTMNYSEKIAFVERVVRYTNHRVPVYANVASCSTSEALALAKKMEELGVDAITSLAPYFVKVNDNELYDYFYTIANSVKIPLILYNIPRFVGYSIPVEVVKRLVESNIGVLGMKDSSGDMELFAKYAMLTKASEFKVMVGSDSKISEAHALGASACVAGTSNLITNCIVSLWDALNKKEVSCASKLQEDIEVLRGVLGLGTQPSIIKRSMVAAKIADVGAARKPVNSPNKNIDIEIFKVLKKLEIVK